MEANIMMALLAPKKGGGANHRLHPPADKPDRASSKARA